MVVRLQRVIAIAALAVLVVASLGRIAAANFDIGTIECCCGEHGADVACGCPDCPAVHADDDDRGPPADGAPRMEACGPDAKVTLPPAAPPMLAPPRLAVIPPPARVLRAAPPRGPIDAPVIRPDAPPPRA